MKKIGKNV